MRRTYYWAIAIFLILLSSFGFSRKIKFQRAVDVALSPSGQIKLKNLEEVLQYFKFDLNQGAYSKMSFEIGAPLSNQSIPAPVRNRSQKIVETIKQELLNFFIGLPLKNQNWVAELSNIQYKLEPVTMDIFYDPNGKSTYRKKKGVVLVTQAEYKFGVGTIGQMSLWDKNHPQAFGKIKLNNLWSSYKADPGEITAKIEVPLWFYADEKGLHIEALRVHTNLTQFSPQLGFEKLDLPPLSVVVNGNVYRFDEPKFQRRIRQLLPDIREIARSYAKNWVEQDSRPPINKQLERISTISKFDMPLTLPSSKNNDPTHRMLLLPTELEELFDTEKYIFLGLHGDLDEVPSRTLSQSGSPISYQGGSRITPHRMQTYQSDIAIGLQSELIQSMVDESYRRGLISSIEIEGKDEAKHRASPVFDFNSSAKEPKVFKVRVKMLYKVNGLSGINFKSSIPIDFTLEGKLEINDKNQIELVAKKILTNDVVMDLSVAYVAKMLVRRRIIKSLDDKTQTYQKKREVLGTIPGLEQIFGYPLELVGAEAEKGRVIQHYRFLPR